VLLLCSNNYLGLADHPRVREAAAEGAMRWGVGAGASRLISGTMTIHHRLEERLAEFHGSRGCVLFGSGYLANLGVIGAMAGRGDAVFSDELNHASIIDACRLCRAEVFVYRHRDLEHLDWLIGRRCSGAGAGGRLIVTDSVFSMDGDVAPLREMVELAHHHQARTVVDEAHATGAMGPDGRGLVAQAGLQDQVDVIVGTLGKALGSYGAYACASPQMVRYLINTARSLIFSTAPPPPAVAGALAALELLSERPHRVQRLRSNARALRRALALEGFAVADGDMHITPLVVGDERAAMLLCQEAIERGVFAQAIRPPTVPLGASRLRLAAMASHTVSELRMAAEVFARAARKIGLDLTEIGHSAEHDLPGAGQQTESDLESAITGELTPAAFAQGGRDVEPFDFERVRAEPFDFERDAASMSAAAGEQSERPNAPFDIERETPVPRAA
jgi:glycine C-acetyltransferase/8-amino-7-oxononanoate synthase